MSQSQISRRFAELRKTGEAAFVPFIMAGDPDLDATREMLQAVAGAGADLIELGVPFSDPTADGPILQRSAARALERGTSLQRILEMVSDLRQTIQTPIVLFGYYNPVFHYGPERLSRDAKQAGVDGLLIVDLPPEESDELWHPAHAAGLDMIFLLAPTSDDRRIKAVLRRASGFLYYVSMTGVTGSRSITPADVRPAVEHVRSMTKLPIGVGFGISSGEEAAAVATFADAVVVGSSIMRRVEEHGTGPGLADKIGGFARELKQSLRRPS